MKITGYNAGVNPNTVSAGVKVSGDLNAYGGRGNGARAVSNALGKVQAAYEHVAEEEDKRALMFAMDIYNKGRYDILYNDENGVLNTKLEGAAGSVGNYLEREKKLRNDIMGNMKFRTEKYKLAFQDMVNKSAEQGYQLVDRHEYKEMEAQQDLTLNNNLENMLQFAQKNYGNDDSIMQSVADGRLMIAARFGDRGEEYVDKINKQFEGKMGEMLINQALLRGEFDRAGEIQSAFNEAFSPDQRARIDKLVFTKQKNQFEMGIAESLVARYGEDLGAMMADLENTNAFGADRLMDLSERQHVFNLAQSIVNTNKAIERANFDKVYDNSLDNISEMIEQNVQYTEAMKWAGEQAGGDTKTLKALQSAVNICYGRASGAGLKPIPEGEMLAVDELLRRGRFETEDDYLTYLSRLGADKKQIVKARQNYKDFRNGVGKYAYDFEDLKIAVMGSKSLKDGQKAKWDGAMVATADDIANFTIKNKRPPNRTEVINMLSENMTKGIRINYRSSAVWWSTFKATNAELALVGLENISQVDDDTYIVQYMDGSRAYQSAEQVEALIDRANKAVK